MTHIYRAQREFVDVIALARKIDAEHEPDLILAETNGLGASFISRMREIGIKQVDGVPVRDDKEVRAQAVTPLLERGEVRFWRKIPQLDSFLDELLSFPSGRYNDQVDAFSLPLFLHLDVKRVVNASRRVKRYAVHQTDKWGVSNFHLRVNNSGFVDRWAERNYRRLW